MTADLLTDLVAWLVLSALSSASLPRRGTVAVRRGFGIWLLLSPVLGLIGLVLIGKRPPRSN